MRHALRRTLCVAALLCTAWPVPARAAAAAPAPPRLVLAIHGGAGAMPRAAMTSAQEAAYREALGAALDAGFAVLERGGTSLDSVVAAVRLLEDDPLFNAGKGAVLNRAGIAELDAAIMDGHGLRAGAVAAVRHVKNPIELARAVMERSPHVMLIGAGAEEFALEQGFALVPGEYFRTERRVRELRRALEGDLGSSGTVGAVALDARGHLAAATSTGGMTAKRQGRVGDSPIIGAGTYANDASCAVSATGHGEYFMRLGVAADVCALVAYRGLALERAAREVVHGKLAALGGTGGVIALDARGNFALEFNTEGMLRAVRTSTGRRAIAIYREE